MSIVKNILTGNLSEALEKIEDKLFLSAQRKLTEVRKMIPAADFLPEEEEILIALDESRFRIVRARVRHGKILRRHKEATRKGFTMRGGKVTKMMPRERRNRKLAQRKAAKKRRGKLSRSRMNMKKALRKRRAMGL